ncbi:MAG: competence protein TfoX [Acidobacteria bacterium]|nr:MAG: competence protein TfoX [Acidobacteriota bacterium]
MATTRPKKNDTEKLESLPNVGRVIAGKLRKIGIRTVSEFLERDPYDVFDELRTEADPELCRCALASIVGARYGVKWHQITAESAREYERRHPGYQWGKC